MDHTNQLNATNDNWFNPNVQPNFNQPQHWQQQNVQHQQNVQQQQIVQSKPLTNHLQHTPAAGNYNVQPHLQQVHTPNYQHESQNYYGQSSYQPTTAAELPLPTQFAPQTQSLNVAKGNGDSSSVMESFGNNQGDGWGDWDWNDNNKKQPQPPHELYNENHNYNSNVKPEPIDNVQRVSQFNAENNQEMQNYAMQPTLHHQPFTTKTDNKDSVNFFDTIPQARQSEENMNTLGYGRPASNHSAGYINTQLGQNVHTAVQPDANIYGRPSSNLPAGFSSIQHLQTTVPHDRPPSNHSGNTTLGPRPNLNQQSGSDRPSPNQTHIYPPSLGAQIMQQKAPLENKNVYNADYSENVLPIQSTPDTVPHEHPPSNQSGNITLGPRPNLNQQSGSDRPSSEQTHNYPPSLGSQQKAPLQNRNSYNVSYSENESIQTTPLGQSAEFVPVFRPQQINSENPLPLPTTQLSQPINYPPVVSPLIHPINESQYQNSETLQETPSSNSTDNFPIPRAVNENLSNQPGSHTNAPHVTSEQLHAPLQTPRESREEYLYKSAGFFEGVHSQTPINYNSSSATIAPPPPPIVQSNLSQSLPPPVSGGASRNTSDNPFKRTGQALHHRADGGSDVNQLQQTLQQPQFFAPPPPPEGFANTTENVEILQPYNVELFPGVIEESRNQQIAAPTNDRNQYLQTSHLSEQNVEIIGENQNSGQEQNNENDAFPPPGLSRLVLGQPETEIQQFPDNEDNNEIPPNFDRLIPGTELESALNLERQADGQDTIQSTRSAFVNPPSVNLNDDLASNIDIAGDRNLYLVPGESDINEQRVVTGVENVFQPIASGQVELREVELDGENLEDQQQQLQNHTTFVHAELDLSSREEPIEGANTLDSQNLVAPHQINETESNLTTETNVKDLSNFSTGNESDARERHSTSTYSKSRRSEEKKRLPEKKAPKDKRYNKDHYDSEESELSSDRERRNYREGSVRSDRDYKDRKRRDKEQEKSRREKYHDDRRHDNTDRYKRDKDRDSKYGSSKYEADSRYKLEESGRYERRRGGERDRDSFDEYLRSDKDRRYRKERRDDRGRVGGDNEERDYRERRDRRDKNRSDYEDNYRKLSSRNARESDFEKDRGRGKDQRYSQNMYGYGSNSYGYDAYTYYQHQQYYEQLRRTNPQAYAEWYRKYYGQVQPDSLAMDGRESVHSGRSSANNEKDRYSLQHQPFITHQNDYHRQFIQPSSASTTLNSTMIEQHLKPDTYGIIGGQPNSNLLQINQITEMDCYNSGRSYYAIKDYPKKRPDTLPVNINDGPAPQEPARLTPCKFTTSHSTVSLSTGVLVTVKPKYSQNGISNVVKLLKIGAHDGTRRLFQSFPGPLLKGLTHKKTIIEFCEEQIKMGPPSAPLRSRQNSATSLCSMSQANKASYTLMWNLLILLLRQNGMVVGTDIAELLMKNQNQFSYMPSVSVKSNDANSRQGSELPEQTPSDGDDDEAEDGPDANIDSEQSGQSEPTTSLTEEEITAKFRDYLLYGNVNEALDWATENNLWGHALFLASKVDRRSHANVMMKFANKLALNDPLQTLYQLMSGRCPSSVTSIQDEKWGDWRPHLSMILSNTSSKPELDRKSITTLGDSLFNRGDLFGAHFCYLMAQVGFGKYSSVNQEQTLLSNATNVVRLVLLGSSHNKNFNDFATNEAIMMTEIYEYACSLNDDKFSIVEFQPYKYLLATRMLDYGYHLKSLMYTEQISLHIQMDPSKYEHSFIEKIFNLADRLKFYDPALEKSLDNTTEDGHADISGGLYFEEQQWLQNLRSIVNQNVETTYSQYSDNGINGISSNSTANPSEPPSSEINQAFSEINRQFDQLNLQYTNFEAAPYDANNPQYQQYPTIAENEYIQPNEQTAEIASQIQQPLTDSYGGQYYNAAEVQQQQSYIQPQQTQYTQDQEPAAVGQQQQQQQPSYDYWTPSQYAQNQSENTEPPKPTISMPNAASARSGFYGEQNSHEDTTNQLRSSATTANDTKKPATNAKKSLPKDGASLNANQNSGWFGGIWNKLSMKPKNQMILPDDKNPAIVWDADKKRWVNTDGDAEEQESFKPPPKISEMSNSIVPLMPAVQSDLQPPTTHSAIYNPTSAEQIAQTQTQPMVNMGVNQNPSVNSMSAPSVTENATKTPSLQSNMFKMQRNRTLKKSYVDVFNPSGAQPAKPVEQVLAPALPPAVVPQSGFFIPSGAPSDSSQPMAQQQQDNAGPQFYNPNVYQQQ